MHKYLYIRKKKVIKKCILCANFIIRFIEKFASISFFNRAGNHLASFEIIYLTSKKKTADWTHS